MATFYQTQRDDTYHIHEYADSIEKESSRFLTKFRQLLNSYTLFHASFFVVALMEIVIFSLSLLNYAESVAFVITLASMILTLFSYLILNYYFQGKKIEELRKLQIHFLQACQKLALPTLTDEEIHLAIGKNAFQLAATLGQKRIYALSLPPFEFFKEFLIKGRFLLHFNDVLKMQELLIQLSLDEYIAVLKLEPTDLAIHTSLANVYMTLAKIYQPPSELSSYLSSKFIGRLQLEEKSTKATLRALEELKILDDLAPNDPWTHAQLASCYHNLERLEDELSEYEILSNLRSKDKEILLRLGVLYFRLGKTAKGLLTYESLKKIDAKYGDHLLSHYHSFRI